jgi:DNA polymerase-1
METLNTSESGVSGGNPQTAALPAVPPQLDAKEIGTISPDVGLVERPSLPLAKPSIPPDINVLDRLAAAQFYVYTLGWAVHPLLPPDRGDPCERGKKPITKGWRNHSAAEISPDYLAKYLGNGATYNIGSVVRPPFVHVDLDSKPDAGASVMAWLAEQPELATVPRERTGGGVHLAFICRDLPAEVMKLNSAPTCQINEKVAAELYKDGLNIVLSPSVHKSGHRYIWEVTGDIPEVKWADLCRWFGFVAPEAKKSGRPSKGKPWWSQWKEDLRTLDLAGVMQDLGRLGNCLDPDTNKWSVRCPWEADHSAGAADEPGSDTIIFNQPETMPGFKCLHAHCESRSIQGVVEWVESQKPGIIAAHCANLRVWQPGNNNAKGRPMILLPTIGRPYGEFCTELGNLIAPAKDMFRFADKVVEIKTAPQVSKKGAPLGQMLSAIEPAVLVTAVERTVETGGLIEDEAGDQVFMPKSMNELSARIVLASSFFSSRLPLINRVLDVPVPHLSDDGKLVYPKPGYDERFGTWLNPHAPQLKTMGYEEALRWLLQDLFGLPEHGGFWWQHEQARVHALARFITPFCRGLMDWRRAPLWIFDGNREGCGKDTCADLTHIAYTGRSIIGAPLSKECDDEMRKRITSALMAGTRFFHLANMKGHVRYASLEAATDDSGMWEDRRLGESETVILPNETEYSFSANNATWEPDIERRCRRIRLHFTPDDINSHRYRHSDIKGWVRDHRSELLSAVAVLVNEWVRVGCPPGPSPFTSFPEWGRVVGGILHSAGLPDPCLPHEDSQSSGDQSTRAMRHFFALAFEQFRDREVLKKEFQEFIQQNDDVHELFDWLDFNERRGLMSFGRLIAKFDKRELGGITFRLKRTSKNCASYRFFRECQGEGQGEGELPVCISTLQPAPSNQGLRDFEGLLHHVDIFEGNPSEENKQPYELNAAHISDREKPREAPKPRAEVFCSLHTDLDRIALDLAGVSRIALDIETYGERKGEGLDPWKGDIRLLTLCRHGGTIWTIDLRAIGYDLGPLVPILDETGIIAHNAKFDLLWLRVKCGLFVKRVHCTLTAARMLVAGTKPGNNLDQCLVRYLGVEPAADHSRSDWASMLLTDDQLAYAARDVAHLHDLLGVMETEIELAGLDTVWALESALLPCVVGMEATGIRVDREKLQSVAVAADKLTQQATDDLRAALGNPSINLASPAQVLAALRAAGLSLESTAEVALKAADDGRLIPLVLAHRESSKRAQQAHALVGHIKSDGRIHGRFEPLGTATGRFSSKEPNLQNIGRGEMRKAFTAPEGKRLVVADYSQIELRAAAAIAGETQMIDAYKAGADLHKLTAATVLDKPEDQVTKSDRQLAKAVNFGLLYGQSAPGLVRYAATSYGVTLDENQAQSIRHAFFRTYSRLRQWHGSSHNQSEAGVTEVRTRTGRRRLIAEKASDWERFTALVNTPVQGGTADGMKNALILIDQRLPKSACIVSTVHDEVVVECHEDTAEQCREIITTAMVEAMAALFPEVPVEVEANICNTWAEK